MRNEFQGRRAEFWRNLRDRKCLHEMNSKITQTDDNLSIGTVDKACSVPDDNIEYQETSIYIDHHYDEVFCEEDEIASSQTEQDNKNSQLEQFSSDDVSDPPILYRDDEVGYCSFENIKNQFLTEHPNIPSLIRDNASAENLDYQYSDSTLHTQASSENFDDQLQESLSGDNSLVEDSYELFEDNAVLIKAEEIEFEPLFSNGKSGHDDVEQSTYTEEEPESKPVSDSGTQKEDSYKEQNSTSFEDARQGYSNEQIDHSESLIDKICKEILLEREKSVSENIRSSKFIASAELNTNDRHVVYEEPRNAIAKSATEHVLEKVTSIDSHRKEDRNESSFEPKLQEAEVVSRNSEYSEGSETEEDRPPFPIIKQSRVKLMDDLDQRGEPDWDKIGQRF